MKLPGLWLDNLQEMIFAQCAKKTNNMSETRCLGRTITVRDVAKWLSELPEDWQDTEFNSCWAGMPCTLKRIVALESKDGSLKCVTANSMGTHLPFDASFKWYHTLS